MKRFSFIITTLLLLLTACSKQPQALYRNPLFPKCGPDPWAIFYNGNYYYMHTMQNRLCLWVTPDITDVRNAPCKTIWTPTDSTNMFDLWAPEIHRINGKWYVYYAADDGNTDNHQLYVLENDCEDPFEGEFVMKGRISTDPDNNWAIDGSVFENNGNLYMVWSGWQTRRVSTETQCIYIARMENPWTLSSERVVISRPDLDWERHWINENGWTPPYTIYVNEGPQPLLSPDGKYVHIAYSASGCWTPYYALGLLTAPTDADLLDPASWQKSPKPVFHQKPEAGVYGTGHNSFFQSPDGKEWYILYHARSTETDPAGMGDTRTPRMQRFEWGADGFPIFGEPLPTDTALPKPSGTPVIRKEYHIAGNNITTPWGERIDPTNVLPEYPRPQMVRSEWLNLNGLWQYAIMEQNAPAPRVWDGDILVPFCLESALSGVAKTLPINHTLWYHRTFTLPHRWRGQHIMLNFGAVDWQAQVYVNGTLAGAHTGDYTPFSIDITPYLTRSGEQTLEVAVIDPTDRGYQPRGKQVNDPNGIWYTAVSGIWQTVWLEPVADNHITSVKTIPDLASSVIRTTVETTALCEQDLLTITLSEQGKVIAQTTAHPGEQIALSVPSPRLWSPDSPFLYDLQVVLSRDGKTLDQVASYTAMRSIGMAKDDQGIYRMTLNGTPLFQYGPLDQGWWPDGLYTAPADSALIFDILTTKQLGFNMIRKHVKVEPARWYYHCDRLGMLVWQDMPSGDVGGNHWAQHTYEGGTDQPRSEQSIADYYNEWRDIMDFCMSYPSVVVWVPFNEAWGQFATETVTDWTKHYDPSRLVNCASGGNFRRCGDILDLHNYPAPAMYLYDPERVNVLGEYGGIGLPIEGHLWGQNRNWGYIKFTSTDEVTAEYTRYARSLADFVRRGFSAAVYTQTSDVEGEVNGLLTYDRRLLKVNPDSIRTVNRFVISQLHK